MTSIPLVYGAKANENADLVASLPVNLETFPFNSGISSARLGSAIGGRPRSIGPGVDRAGTVWKGVQYRVMGSKLVSVAADGTTTTLGDVGATGTANLDRGADRLQIRSGTSLYYWDGTTLTQVTDTDLGPCIDQCHMDGFSVSTDGTYVVVTDLANPTSVNPLKYGSAEVEPDSITGLLHQDSGELIVFGENTIQPFTNVGGSGFPFSPNISATIPFGCVGPMAKCHFLGIYAFVGGAQNSATGVWLGLIGTPKKISNRAVDDAIAAVADQSTIEIEARSYRDENRLLVHLPDKTLVYLHSATQANNQENVWCVARSGRGMDKAYRLKNAILAHGEWWVGDTESAQLGILDGGIAMHFGEAVGWQFDTQLIYDEAKGGIIHRLELVGTPGRGVADNGASVFLSFTHDGETYSTERANLLPAKGQRQKRTVFDPHKLFRNYVGLRFRGDSNSLVGWSALEAEIEGLAA